MINEIEIFEEASQARKEYFDYLISLGAHSVAVDKINNKTFAVIIFVEKEIKNAPEYLVIRKGKKSINVPLKVRISEKFKPEI